MATAGEGSGAGRKDEGDEALARALKNLELREGELDDVFIAEQDLASMRKKARWLAVARLNTRKTFSSEALFETLRYVWGLAVDPELREVDDNLFTFKFFCLGDWNKVMNQGPWLFRKLHVMIAEYDGVTDPAMVPLNRVAVWAQIHSLPELYRDQLVVDQLARRIGQVKCVEVTHKRWYEGDYIRVRASIDVAKPLIRFVPLNIGSEGRKMLPVKYEKVGYFCDVCGTLGHDLEECGDGIHKDEDIQYGKWMLAERKSQISGVPSFRASFPGRFGGHGRGGRGGFEGARKRLSGDVFADDDLDDTASSPIKNQKPVELVTGVEEEMEDASETDGARENGKTNRLLNFDDPNIVEMDGVNGEEQGGGKISPDVVPPPPPGYVPPREKKRSKKGQTNSTPSSNDDKSAASIEEDRRDQ
ncbi:hypothetical protein ACQ4PT_027080 [Festuca glaucescens]